MSKEQLLRIQQITKSRDLQEIEFEKCRRDPWYWLENWVWTLDAHDEKNPIKRFPLHDYLKVLTIVWSGPKIYSNYKEKLQGLVNDDKIDEIFDNWQPLLLVKKSRQMKITWLFTALYLWEVQFHIGKDVFFQSKKQDDSDDLVKRSKFIYDHEPFFLKRNKVNPLNKGEHTFCLLSFPEINSQIQGIPQGGDQIRMQTASGIFSDEMAFQEEAEDAFTAAKPTVDGGGRFTGVSSANPGFFDLLVEDKIGTR